MKKLICLLFALIFIFSLSGITTECSEHDLMTKNYIEATCEEGSWVQGCKNCDYEYIETSSKLEHTYTVSATTTASCTKDGTNIIKCSRCGYSYEEKIKAKGHIWSIATCLKEKQCGICGITEGTKADHHFSDNICTICGEEGKKTITAVGGIKFIVPNYSIVNNYGTKCKVTIENIKYNMNVMYSIECISNPNGVPPKIEYTVINSRGQVIATNDQYLRNLQSGQKAPNQWFTMYTKTNSTISIRAGETYTIIIK